METKDEVFGVTGHVKVDIQNTYNPLIIYQFIEYIIGQVVGRGRQTLMSEKVDCLAGALNLIKIVK